VIAVQERGEAPAANERDEGLVLGYSISHMPRERDDGSTSFNIISIHHHELEVARVDVEETVQIGGNGNAVNLHRVEGDEDDWLKALCVCESRNCPDVIGESSLLGEQVRGAKGFLAVTSEGFVLWEETLLRIPIGAEQREPPKFPTSHVLVENGKQGIERLTENLFACLGSSGEWRRKL
jgi:hypothetical protein